MKATPASRLRFAALLALWPSVLLAHAGHDHGASSPDALRQSVSLAKPLQRALEITTTRVDRSAAAAAQDYWAQVVAQPAAASQIQAPEAGRLHAAAGGWPHPGQRVVAGQWLATLEPALSQREQAQRQAALGALEQRIAIADLNLERLQLQNLANSNGASGNVYYEQAVAEARALHEQREFMRQSLAGRIEIRAAQAGVVQQVAVSVGDVVSAGQRLLSLQAVAPPRLALAWFEPGRLEFAGGVMRSADGSEQALLPRGQAPMENGAPGWTLWFDTAAAPAQALSVGQIVPLRLALRAPPAGALRLARASVQGLPDAPHVWLHAEPERFERRDVRVLALEQDSVIVEAADLNADDRLVEGGAALLSQY